MSQTILVTGASSGFGLLIAKQAIHAGHNLIASLREPEGRNKSAAEKIRSLGGHVVEIDVTDDQSVGQGVAAALEIADHIDVLVNNAGCGVLGIQDTFTVDELRALFEVNVFGVHRMQRALVPHFVERNCGLIINISSTLGRITFPFFGPYNASKWAMEALSENARTELSAFGVDVTIIEPGGFPTNFFTNTALPTDQQRLAMYGDMVHAPAATRHAFEKAFVENPQQDPQKVAQAVLTVINTPVGQRAFRTVVDGLGMAEPLEQYNDHLHQVTEEIYTAFGVAHMLTIAG